MGYRPPKTVYKLDFSETEYAGLEVAVRAASIGKLTGLQELADQQRPEAGDVRKMYEAFAELLVSWNVEDDDGEPVPATYEGVASQELGFVQAIILAWMANITKAPPPLQGASGSGGNSEEEPIPGLAAASRSRRS